MGWLILIFIVFFVLGAISDSNESYAPSKYVSGKHKMKKESKRRRGGRVREKVTYDPERDEEYELMLIEEFFDDEY